MKELSLFTGAGGGLLASHLLGWSPVGYVEINDYCQRVIKQRILDGYIPNAPIFGDIRSFNHEGFAASYQGMVDVVSAGFPCQPFSQAGQRKGGNVEKNMWPATMDTIRIIKPRWVWLENVRGLLAPYNRQPAYFGRILQDLANNGYDANWTLLGGHEIGLPVDGKRIFIAATNGQCLDGLQAIHAFDSFIEKAAHQKQVFLGSIRGALGADCYPNLLRNRDAVATIMERLKAIGNGQSPPLVEAAWTYLTGN